MIAAHLEALEACAAEARRVAGDLDDHQINWRREPGAWSIAECLMHLTATSRIYEPAFARAVAAGRARGRTGPGPFAPDWVGRWFAGLLEPPARRRFTTPRRFRPPHRTAPAEGTRREYAAAGAAIQEVIRSAAGLDLARIRMRSPLTPLLRFNLEAGFRIHAAHERRHLWQARRVREAEEFPA